MHRYPWKRPLPDRSRYYFLEKPGLVKTFTILASVPKEGEPGIANRRLPSIVVGLGFGALLYAIFAFLLPEGEFDTVFKVFVVLGAFTGGIFLDWCQRLHARQEIAEERKKNPPPNEQKTPETDPGLDGNGEEKPFVLFKHTRQAFAETVEELSANSEPLTDEEVETADILSNAKGEGVEFNFETGEIVRIGFTGSCKQAGELSEIADFQFRKDQAVPFSNYDYVVVWKNRMKPVLRFSPIFGRPEKLAVYRETIVPRLKTLLADYRASHVPADDSADDTPIRSLADWGKTSLFHDDGWDCQRTYWGEPLVVTALFAGATAWLVLSSYGWLGTGIVTLLVLFAGFLLYGEDKRLVISPHNRSIIVYSGFGYRAEEFSFDDFERFAIRRALSLNNVTMYVNGRMGITVLLTLDLDRAVASVNEVCDIMGLDSEKVMTVE